ncbi:MAG: hypothetical protein IPK64_18885 [bacterium]|nr:hypothetical protein [bacterium]
MPVLAPLNLADLREASLRDDLDADARAATLLEWHARDLRATGAISLLLERWVLAAPGLDYDRFLGMHRLFRPWAGDDEAALASWRWWTEEGPAARAAPSRRPGTRGTWRVLADGDRRPAGPRDESAMHRLGYLVGESHGLSVASRRALLDRFFTEPLPALVRTHHGDDYGEPGSEKRLRRMSALMAWNIERFRRHDPARFGASVAAWASDLEYLRARWHDGWFAFPWPRVTGACGDR